MRVLAGFLQCNGGKLEEADRGLQICFRRLLCNIYILIALTLDESIILDVLQFPMKNIYQSCDLGRTIGCSHVNASQKRCLFTDVCVTSVTYRYDVKGGN